MNDIVFDKEYTSTYRDKYNKLCDCEYCNLFISKFPNKYPDVVDFLSYFGISLDAPLEIMSLGISDTFLQHEYIAYYAVKGYLPVPKLSKSIGDISITMRNDTIAKEAYANTDMPTPFFIIEISDIFLIDNNINTV